MHDNANIAFQVRAGLSQIPLRCPVVDRSELVADGFEAGRRPAASWNLAYQGTRLKQVCDKSATSLGPVCDQDKKVKVKASHTRHRALGPELIPVYRQSARR